MIRHIVMWKFKDFAEGLSREENLLKVKTMLEALPGKIDFIREMQVQINVNPKDGMYDAVLLSTFDTLDDVARYRVHPEHIKISSYVALIRENRASVDYEFERDIN
ncbi:MAG: Dabb family protein [Ruminococcaceae bacterium]|nr:Dabb family protein [Oscillospiraceae bacterium]